MIRFLNPKRRNGNGTTSWQDAELTPKGEAQVSALNTFWKNSLRTSKIPIPQRFYVGPMARGLSTANTTRSDLPITFSPIVKELLREPINVCTCAWRHPKSWIQSRYPAYAFEPGFTEEDELWKRDFVIEDTAGLLALTKTLLDDVFATDKGTFISFTTHGVVIQPILQLIGHPNPSYNPRPGEVIPVLVKAKRNEVVESATAANPPTPAKTCSLPGGTP
ncbi:hypothetical protein B0H66DRAFT_607247 [Apodospora peruviana]|uniref:Phosphoglycerate mutase n=1 Tax=Apodospora peruviana TaxID=516989 RepID=A0AAE0LZZ2_9PEZI|nr:hypothetical protein B0H66DRAFT_607247 [Apodospora peruviana]